jgi:hypothetical protein
MRQKYSSKLGLWFATVPALIAAGCGPAAPARTVSYFQAHPMEREALFKHCADDPGTLGKTPECVNASQAEALAGFGSFQHLPPLHLPPIAAPAAKPNAASEGNSGSPQ